MTFFVLSVVFLLSALYQAGRAEYWKHRAEPVEDAWRKLARR